MWVHLGHWLCKPLDGSYCWGFWSYVRSLVNITSDDASSCSISKQLIIDSICCSFPVFEHSRVFGQHFTVSLKYDSSLLWLSQIDVVIDLGHWIHLDLKSVRICLKPFVGKLTEEVAYDEHCLRVNHCVSCRLWRRLIERNLNFHLGILLHRFLLGFRLGLWLWRWRGLSLHLLLRLFVVSFCRCPGLRQSKLTESHDIAILLLPLILRTQCVIPMLSSPNLLLETCIRGVYLFEFLHFSVILFCESGSCRNKIVSDFIQPLVIWTYLFICSCSWPFFLLVFRFSICLLLNTAPGSLSA